MARGGRGGGRGGGRSSGPLPRDVQVSKKLSWLLRHGAEKEGLKLGRGGYMNLGDVLNNRNIKSLQPRPTLSEIQSIVATNEKQRFSLIPRSAYQVLEHSSESASATFDSTPDESTVTGSDQNPENFFIRANQGHSLAVANDDLLTPLTLSAPSALPAIVVHGTRRQLWDTILKSGGLKPMGRIHAHFAMGVPLGLREAFGLGKDPPAGETSQDAAMKGLSVEEQNGQPKTGTSEDEAGEEEPKEVLSGMRNSSTLLIFLDLRKALNDGVGFFVSQNGVVLSPGVPTATVAKRGEAIISVKYFSKVIERGGNVLCRDGVVLK